MVTVLNLHYPKMHLCSMQCNSKTSREKPPQCHFVNYKNFSGHPGFGMGPPHETLETNCLSYSMVMQTSKLGSQNLKSTISELQWISTFRVVYIWNFILSSPGGVRFFAPVQTGPGAYPASCTMSTGSLSRTVKLPGHGIDHPPPSSKKKGKVIPLQAQCGPEGG